MKNISIITRKEVEEIIDKKFDKFVDWINNLRERQIELEEKLKTIEVKNEK